MGCASSKVLGGEFAAEKGNAGFSKGISMPIIPHELPDDFHIVALTSSTYGILKVDPPKPPEEDGKDGMGARSVKDVLNKLNNLESKAESAPQSWLEVSSMLENLKPDLDKPTNTKPGKAANNKPQQPDSIDINDIMIDLDEDTGLVRPKARKLANLKKSGRSLPIHTLEELDKRLGGGKVNSLKSGTSPMLSIADVRASLKPVGTAKSSTTGSDKTANVSMQKNTEQKPCPVAEEARDREIQRDSVLIDDDFLQSYKSAFNTLSEDEWKVVEALCEESELNSKHDSGDEERDNEDTHKEMEQKEEHVAKGSFESEEISFMIEEEENTSLLAQGNSVVLSPSPAEAESKLSKGGEPKKSPLEQYEELCPPGGKQAVVLYTTSLRGIRKTYEDCIKAREIVKGYGVLIDERDVSMHLEYRNELRELMQRVVTVPRLFVKGRYIGGAEVISKLAEDGQLAGLLDSATRAHHCGTEGAACEGCAGAKFVPCLECSGSCKVVNERKQVIKCPECNENGLIQCPLCS